MFRFFFKEAFYLIAVISIKRISRRRWTDTPCYPWGRIAFGPSAACAGTSTGGPALVRARTRGSAPRPPRAPRIPLCLPPLATPPATPPDSPRPWTLTPSAPLICPLWCGSPCLPAVILNCWWWNAKIIIKIKKK